MSDKNKAIFIGLVLITGAFMAVFLSHFFLKEDGGVDVEEEITARKNNNNESIISPVDDGVLRTLKGEITSISVEIINITILSEDGRHSFSILESSILGTDGELLPKEYLAVGMEVEASVSGNNAVSLRVLSVPEVIIISPSPNSMVDIVFDIKGKINLEKEVCFSLTNQRTGDVYKDNFLVLINNGHFSIPVDLSFVVNFSPNDGLEGRFSDCKEIEIESFLWNFYANPTVRIKVYFLKNSCDNFYSVSRVISASRSSVRTSIETILNGPNEAEKLAGIFSSANPDERIRDINTEGGKTYIDFSSSVLNTNRCRVSALRGQIQKTLRQFVGGNFVITIEGNDKNSLN